MTLTKVRPYLMILPALTILVCFFIYPIFYMLYLSFFKWNLMSDMSFIGFKNHFDLFASPSFKQVFLNSVYFVILGVFFNIALALLLAIFLRKKYK